ncbi:hypothetical protein SNEBB_000670 [Seison nebaliae]|nr:hypothetical protein SNEBB_000670 [Seison nebaliae]
MLSDEEIEIHDKLNGVDYLSDARRCLELIVGKHRISELYIPTGSTIQKSAFTPININILNKIKKIVKKRNPYCTSDCEWERKLQKTLAQLCNDIRRMKQNFKNI